MTGRNLAESLADKINAKLGYTAPVPSLMSLDVGLGVPEPAEGSSTGQPTATRYDIVVLKHTVVRMDEVYPNRLMEIMKTQTVGWMDPSFFRTVVGHD